MERRRTNLLPLATVLVTVSVLATSNMAGAAGGSSSVVKTITAPYHGRVVPMDVQSTLGCANASTLTPAFFNLAHGHGGFADFAGATSCTGNNTSSAFAGANLYYYLRIPYHGGNTSIYENVTLALHGMLGLVPGVCKLIGTPKTASCDTLAEVETYGYSYLLDNTTGATYSGNPAWMGFLNYTEARTSCISTSCTSTTSGGLTGHVADFLSHSWLFLPGKMVKGDQYFVFVYLYGGALVSLTTKNMQLTGASGSATLHFGKSGLGITENTIVEV